MSEQVNANTTDNNSFSRAVMSGDMGLVGVDGSGLDPEFYPDLAVQAHRAEDVGVRAVKGDVVIAFGPVLDGSAVESMYEQLARQGIVPE